MALLLAFVSSLGVFLTYVLPRPSHKHKFQSAYFAQAFLFCLWAAQMCLAVAHLGWIHCAQIGYPLFISASAYGLYLMILKRYGQGLRARERNAIGIHLSGVLVMAMAYCQGLVNTLSYQVIVLVSVGVPLFLGIQQVRLRIHDGRVHDKYLLFALIATLMVVLIGAPLFLLFIPQDQIIQILVTFGSAIAIEIIFMIAFALSIMQSLVARLRSQLYEDPLTGCKNRHYFYELAPQFLAHAKRSQHELSVVVCDIDHFKAVNDQYGHVVGDKALKEFAATLRRELRQEDALIRMGGEEFLVLSPSCDVQQAQALAERLRISVSAHQIHYKEYQFTLTASFGVIQIHHDQDIFKGIREADQALYQAKLAGRNQVITVGGA